MAICTDPPTAATTVIGLQDRAAWRAALETTPPRPVMAHLNADTTWLLQLPIPSSPATTPSSTPRSPKAKAKAETRTRFNILVDPWLQGPQSDVAAWFSTQWHVVPPAVLTIVELNAALAELEDGPPSPSPSPPPAAAAEEEEEGSEGGSSSTTTTASYIDAVAISHEFTDHCHKPTLLELPPSTPVVAAGKAADLIRSWGHFDTVLAAPAFPAASSSSSSSTPPTPPPPPPWQDTLADPTGALPPWLRIGRVTTAGNALYYHSALLVAFDLLSHSPTATTNSSPSQQPPRTEAIIYSPHGIHAADLAPVRASGIKTLALLHGLDDIRIWMTAQLNLGALNGIQAVRASGARYWIATHDEAKRGGGFISWLLRRTTYSLRDAVQAEEERKRGEVVAAVDDGKEDEEDPGQSYEFVELGSGDVFILS